MNQYQVTVVERPAAHLTGMKVRSTMEKAMQDCPALWYSFGPRIAELQPAGSSCPGSYGVSVMLNAQDFEYWATIETAPSSAIPTGMETMELPAGRYASCTVAGIEKLGEAYTYLYETWPGSQSEYTCDEQGACFELYPPNWQPADAFEIYMSVKKKG